MIEWLGGEVHVIDILIAFSGICLLVTISKIAQTNGSERYLIPAFCCWFGFELLIGLEDGTLISFPHPIGMIVAVVLLIGFIGLLARGVFAVWKARKTGVASL